MRIFAFNEKYYCKVAGDYSFDKLEQEIYRKIVMKEGSFANQYSRKIFSDCFRYATDLKAEYLNYYDKEYDSLELYLYKKELLEYEDIEEIDLKTEESLLRLGVTLSSYNTQLFLEDEDSRASIINKLLMEIKL